MADNKYVYERTLVSPKPDEVPWFVVWDHNRKAVASFKEELDAQNYTRNKNNALAALTGSAEMMPTVVDGREVEYVRRTLIDMIGLVAKEVTALQAKVNNLEAAIEGFVKAEDVENMVYILWTRISRDQYTDDEVYKVGRGLRRYLDVTDWKRCLSKEDMDAAGPDLTIGKIKQHLGYMASAGLHYLDTGVTNKELAPIYKANRWLGFIQGVVWMLGDKTINHLRQDMER